MLSALIHAVLVVVAVVLLLQALLLAIQVLLALLPVRDAHRPVATLAPIAVLVPAHDEALVIEPTLRALMPQLRPEDRLLVVADNCSDETAAIARDVGAEVVERTSLAQRGKGFALDFGIQHLQQAPPETLVICDADCIVEPGGLVVLATASQTRQQPVQGLYLMKASADDGIASRLRALAWRLKNQVRALGNLRLGTPCQMMGTGFALPWQQVADLHFATDNLVEDMQLGVDLAVAGHPIRFCPNALVTSNFPSTDTAATGQSRRWEHGHLSTIMSEVPRLLGAAVSQGRVHLLLFALDLSVPPLALMGMLVIGLMLWAAGIAWLTGLTTALLLGGGALLCLMLALLVTRWRFGADLVTFLDLLGIPLYMLRKLPIYLGFLWRRQRTWVRTDRE